jgi:hypothetical protein
LLFGSSSCFADTALTLDGRYEYRTDAESLEIIGRRVCFFPSEDAANFLPRPSSDHRLPWFCFTNTESATQALRIEGKENNSGCGLTGTATVQVQDYEVYSGEGDGFDTAYLSKLVRVSESKDLPCT